MTEEERLEEEEDHVSAWGLAIEFAVLAVLMRRFGKLPESFTYVDSRRWLTEDMAEIERILSKARRTIGKESERAFDSLADHLKASAAPFYEARGITMKDSPFVAQAVKTGAQSAKTAADSLVKTSVMRIVGLDGKKHPIADVYKAVADMAVQHINAGRYNPALIQAATEAMSMGGVSVEYASGAKRELYSALSMNVMDAYRSSMDQVREQQAAEFGADGYEVSTHSLCAPDHLPYQGKQFTFAEFEQIQEKLRRPIGKGYNCRHRLTKVIVGVNSQRTPEELAKIRERSEREVEWTDLSGKRQEGTAYEFSQAQRQMEQSIRKLNLASKLQSEAGNTAKAAELQSKAAKVETHYRKQCRAAKIATRPDRYAVYVVS